MKKVITYGTFDLFHFGHLELLRRAKELGDFLVVAVSTDEFNIKNWPLTILYLLTVAWTFSAFGVIIGIIAKSWDEIGSFSNFIFMPMTFLGGVFYSVDMLSEPWRTISYFNPIYWMISGLRYSTLNIGEDLNLISLLA